MINYTNRQVASRRTTRSSQAFAQSTDANQNVPGYQHLTSIPRAKIPATSTSRPCLPAFDHLSAELLYMIFDLLLADIPTLTVQTGTYSLFPGNQRAGLHRYYGRELEDTLASSRGLVRTCRRLRTQYRAYLADCKLFICMVQSPSSNSVPAALSVVTLRHLRYLQLDLHEESYSLAYESVCAKFIEMVVTDLPGLSYLYVDWLESRDWSGDGIVGALDPRSVAGTGRSFTVGELLMFGSFVALRHPLLHRLAYTIKWPFELGWASPRSIELSADFEVAKLIFPKVVHLYTAVEQKHVLLNATSIRRLKFSELVLTPMHKLALPWNSITSRMPDHARDVGFFDSVDRQGYTTQDGYHSSMDSLIDSARAMRARAVAARATSL